MAVIRDTQTGEILSFARGGRTTLRTANQQFSVAYLDGVRTVANGIQ